MIQETWLHLLDVDEEEEVSSEWSEESLVVYQLDILVGLNILEGKHSSAAVAPSPGRRAEPPAP